MDEGRVIERRRNNGAAARAKYMCCRKAPRIHHEEEEGAAALAEKKSALLSKRFCGASKAAVPERQRVAEVACALWQNWLRPHRVGLG